jgi:hypothetical protein
MRKASWGLEDEITFVYRNQKAEFLSVKVLIIDSIDCEGGPSAAQNTRRDADEGRCADEGLLAGRTVENGVLGDGPRGWCGSKETVAVVQYPTP